MPETGSRFAAAARAGPAELILVFEMELPIT